jgi:hypothetical protein
MCETKFFYNQARSLGGKRQKGTYFTKAENIMYFVNALGIWRPYESFSKITLAHIEGFDFWKILTFKFS